MQPLIAASGRDDVDRTALLRTYATLEHDQQTATPDMLYDDVLARVHAGVADRLGLRTTAELDAAFGASIGQWPAFADTANALRFLKKHFRLVILSNVNRSGIAASNRKLGVEFDAIYTAEEIGSYKPAPANFDYLLAHLSADFGLEKDDVLHTAQSLLHDHAPANAFGIANAWIDRQRLSEDGDWGATAEIAERPDVDFLFFTMGEMADAVREEVRQTTGHG